MFWQYYLMTKEGDAEEFDCFTPLEFNDDGTIRVVVSGIAILSSLDAIKLKARKIWKVKSLEDLSDAELVWDADNSQQEVM